MEEINGQTGDKVAAVVVVVMVGCGGGCNTRLPPTLFLVFGRVTQIPALEFRFLLSSSDEQSSVAAAIV